jgi:hypothetical protein
MALSVSEYTLQGETLLSFLFSQFLSSGLSNIFQLNFDVPANSTMGSMAHRGNPIMGPPKLVPSTMRLPMTGLEFCCERGGD